MVSQPFDIGTLHFVGIGGIGMSGIAEVMHNLGYHVQGSDVADNANIARLRKLGLKVSIGHGADNLGEAKVIVVSSAIKRDNPEVMAARERHLPVVRRAEMLAELMRLKWCVAVGGTHGKTTTTSLVAAMLDAGGLDPTVINGGIINAYGTNARLGTGQWMVVEADESDGTFVKLPATVAVVTNIDPEHLDHYGYYDAVKSAFKTFVENIPFYGFAVMCLDHPEVQAMLAHIEDRRVVTYGLSPQADLRAVNLRQELGRVYFDVLITARGETSPQVIENLLLPMMGEHNVVNSLAAIAVAHEMGLPEEAIRRALERFDGVKRRFTHTGSWNGVTVIDDYGHHPVEIAAVLKAARGGIGQGRIIAVVQPHRYSRLRDLFDEFCRCFNDADVVVVAPVYSAGEAPIEGINRDALVDGIAKRGHRQVLALEDGSALPHMIVEIVRPGDMVICLGAGNITAWAQELPQALARLRVDGVA
jgi:UDP-N-acetylmuramate--alanine ligase